MTPSSGLAYHDRDVTEGKIFALKKYAGLWLIPLVLAALSFGARHLARSAWDSLVRFRAPQFAVEPAGRAEPIGRVVLIVVDGLRVDAFNEMEYVSSLKDSAACFVLETGQPSLSLPSSAVIATGAWQDVTGVTTNWFKGPVRQDSLFSLARDSGLTTAIAGEEEWGKLFGDLATKAYTRKWDGAYVTFDEETQAKAIEFLRENPALLLVHFVDTDMAGHDFGGASAEYRRSARHIDTLIAGIHRHLDQGTILLVTSDHGQTDRGGHGGWEDVVTRVPLLMCGKAIRPGTYGSAKQTDIAPTVAALLGLPIPPYSQGRILDEAVNFGGVQARLRELLSAQKEKFTRAYLGAIGINFDRIRGEIMPMPDEDAAQYWDRVLAKGKEARIAGERVRRAPLFLAVLLVPAMAFLYIGRTLRLSWKTPLLLSLLYFAVDYGIFFASGKRVSLSAINEEDLLQRFFNEVTLYAVVSAVAVVILLAFLDRKKAGFEAAKSSLVLMASIAFLIILQVDFFYLYNGPTIGWRIPNMLLGFKYYLDLTSLVAVGFASVIILPISAGAHWVFGRTRR